MRYRCCNREWNCILEFVVAVSTGQSWTADALCVGAVGDMSSINAMLASKKAYHHFFQLHAVGCLFRMAYSMTCMNTILATPLSNVLNFHLNDDTGG